MRPHETTFTQSLLHTQSTSFQAATHTPFLRLAGQGKVSIQQLSSWLSQDRLYGQAYVNFIGALLGHVRLPVTIDKERKNLQYRITDLLTGALENIHREWKFYVDVAERYGLGIDVKEDGMEVFGANEITQQYVDLFRSFSLEPHKSLLEGMVVLWATEKCYLEAWSYASHEGENRDKEEDQDGGALRQEFIPNWTSREFVKFVDEIADLTDQLAKESDMFKEKEACESAWKRVLDLEEKFWPNVEG